MLVRMSGSSIDPEKLAAVAVLILREPVPPATTAAEQRRILLTEADSTQIIDDRAGRIAIIAFNYGPGSIQFRFALTAAPASDIIGARREWVRHFPAEDGPIDVTLASEDLLEESDVVEPRAERS
jgi:hypothetical protein